MFAFDGIYLEYILIHRECTIKRDFATHKNKTGFFKEYISGIQNM